jgi:predicted porin
MKRTLVALAVAGAFLAPAAAMADGSGIVLTGVIHGDIGVGQEKDSDGNKVYERQMNIGTFATRWEIDGTEDLGWAKAIFGLAMDQQFSGASLGGGQNNNNNQVNGTSVNNRNSFLGLTGGFGTIKIGQNEHQYEIQQILQDPDPASENTFSTLSLMTNYGLRDGSIVLPGFTRRDPQSIWYTSPNFGGVTVDLAYVTPAGRKTAGTNPSGIQGAVMWKSAFGLSLYGALAQYNDELGGDNKNQAARLGVGYGTELFQVDVAGEQLQFKDNTGSVLGASGDKVKRTNFMVSGALNFGQHHIRAAVNLAQKAKFNGTTIDDSAARMFLVGYAYTLSKRTEFQVNYGKVDNKAEASYNVSGDGNDADRFGVGIRHTF